MPQTILVVDDEIAIQKFLAELLTEAGYSVLLASTGEQGLQLAAKSLPSLILLDMKMPVTGGKAFLEQYHKTPLPYAPILVMTVVSLGDEIFSRLQVQGYLPKPLDADKLLPLVKLHTKTPIWFIGR